MWTSRALTAQMTTRSISKRNNHLTKKFICPSSSFVTVLIFHKAVCRYRPTCRRAWMTFCQWREQEGYTWNTFWRSLDSVPRAWRRYSNPQERGICEFDRKAFTTEGIWMDSEKVIDSRDSTASLRECTRARREQFFFKIGETGSVTCFLCVVGSMRKIRPKVSSGTKHVRAMIENLLGLGRTGNETTYPLWPSRE